MTLLVNEIHIGDQINDATLVQVADRRITIGGRYHSSRRKIFAIPYLNASIGYFGLAQPRRNDYFSSWVPNIIRHGSSVNSLSVFANYFESELNKYVSKSLLLRNPSGFHLCGFANDGIPEFYFIRNIDHMNGPFYNGFRDHYFTNEHFRMRDAIRRENGAERSLSEVSNSVFWYVNGDLRSFWNFWLPADQFVRQVASDVSFSRPSTLSDRAKWKLESLSSFYQAFARERIVGKPIDAIELRPESNRVDEQY
jgi:hypothetical protein